MNGMPLKNYAKMTILNSTPSTKDSWPLTLVATSVKAKGPKGLQAIDMDSDGKVDWSEFCVYMKWALHQYPKIATTEELLTTTFTKGMIPAMQDEIVKINTAGHY